MKHIIFTILSFFVLASISKAQPAPLYLFVEDNVGRKDTVEFGLKHGATLGIDTLLGEENLYLTQFDSLEIRVIQRDSINYNCLKTIHSNDPIYSIYNRDSKIDYRADNAGGTVPFSSIYFNFEFLVKGYEYPIKVYGDFANTNGYIFSFIALYDDNCENIAYDELRSFSSSDVIFNIDSSNVNTIIVHLEFETGMNDLKNETPTWNLFPNPGNEKLNIDQIPYKNSSLQIFNLLGELLYSTELSDNQYNLDIGFIPQGNYIIRLTDTKNLVFSSKSFIKSSNNKH
jgi:hypothetical protein